VGQPSRAFSLNHLVAKLLVNASQLPGSPQSPYNHTVASFLWRQLSGLRVTQSPGTALRTKPSARLHRLHRALQSTMASEASSVAEPIDITNEIVEAPILDALERNEAPELIIPEFNGLEIRSIKTPEDEARRKARIPPEWVKKNATPKQPKKTRAERKKLNPLRSEKYTPEYIFEDGLRRVKPYYFTFNTFCKERWRDRTLVDVFQSEFRDRPIEYYVCRNADLLSGTNSCGRSVTDSVIEGASYQRGQCVD
jgi:hypothetical protein